MKTNVTGILRKGASALRVTFQGGIILYCINTVITKTAIIPLSFWD